MEQANQVTNEQLFARARTLAGRFRDELNEATPPADSEAAPIAAEGESLSLSERVTVLADLAEAIAALKSMSDENG